MDDLAQWYRAQLDEDERIAQATAWCWSAQIDNPWTARPPRDEEEGWTVWSKGSALMARGLEEADAQHIAEHDPARVLREIDAKRRLLDELLPPPREPGTDSELHARVAHPAYEYRTTEGPRKQWEDADVPPVDENGDPEPGWERNTDAGWDGWERFDYTEESYWRRRLPEGQERKPGAPRWLRLLAAPYAGRPGYRDDWRP